MKRKKRKNNWEIHKVEIDFEICKTEMMKKISIKETITKYKR